MKRARFHVGQVIHHKLFGYRGVIYDVDPEFQGTEAWYEQVARTRPPKDQPWYRVLVDGRDTETYVAERNLEPAQEAAPVDHPLVERFFQGFDRGVYIPRQDTN